MLVLIGIEVLETIKTQETYVVGHTIRVEVVLIVALIAIARKVIILDIKDFSGITLIGVGAVIVALSVGYYLVKRGDSESKSNIPLEPGTKK